MRRSYLDMMKLFIVVLLIPFHTMMIYNAFQIYGGGYYIHVVPSGTATLIVTLFDPWFMKLLFVIAGMSSYYSLKKRSIKQYVTERVLRVGLPFLTGFLVLIPFMVYIGDVSNNGYTGGYWDHYLIFFTKFTHFTGYDGGFGLGHLWFLFFLMVVTLAALPFYRLGKNFPRFFEKKDWSMLSVLALGVLQAVSSSWIPFIYYSLSQCFFLFLIGMFVLSHVEVQEKLEKYRFWFCSSALVSGVGYIFIVILQEQTRAQGVIAVISEVMKFSFGYLMVLALIGLGKRYLSAENRVLGYFTQGSQLFYIFHHPILIAVAFVLIPNITNTALQMAACILVTFILTGLAVEVIRRTPVVRTLFGMKHGKNHGRHGENGQ